MLKPVQLDLRPIQTWWIYAFVEDGKIIYVGQTHKCFYREHQHRMKTPERFAKAKMVPLRSCSEYSATRLERQIILACWRKGEAQLNKAIPSRRTSPNAIRHPECEVIVLGVRYPSISAAARSLGISSSSVKNYANPNHPSYERKLGIKIIKNNC